MSTAAATPPTKAQKILRRTLSGARLVAGLALVLWLTSLSMDGEPVYFAAAAVLLLAVFELSRMGVCRDLPILAVFPGTFAFLAALHFAELRADRRARADELLPEALTGAWSGALANEYLVTGLVALALLTLLRVDRPGRGTGRALLVLGHLGLLAALVVLSRDPLGARPLVQFVAGIAGVVVLAGVLRYFTNGAARAEAGAVVGLALWLLPPLFLLWGLWRAFGSSGLVALLVLSKIGDTAGYYFGSWLGRTHPFPNISPGKTTAGCVASFCAATVLGGVAVATGLLPDGRFGIGGGLAAGAALNLAAQAGDLFESWVKRRAAVKDSSTWFGPSGGLLDQLDSLLFSVPTAVLVFPALFAR